MPELLRMQTDHFELSVWCSDIEKRQHLYRDTMFKRALLANSKSVASLSPAGSVFRFSPALIVNEAAVLDEPIVTDNGPIDALLLKKPLFFENVQYQFEWVFFKNVDEAYLTHRVKTVNNGFRFAKLKHAIPARLTGTINTGNDVGWMRLPLSYRMAGQTYHCQIAFEVLPTKMDLHSDLPAMYQAIDKTYPLWRFSLAEKTEQDASRNKQRGHFPLLWLANFNTLRQRFEQGLKVITQAPHNRLQPKISYIRADRLKGRLPHHLIKSVKEDFANGLFNKRYRIEKQHLSVDTPENRFIKMVVSQCKNCLTEFERKLRHNNEAPDNQRISDEFLSEISSWQKPLKKMLQQSFFREVGTFKGLASESLVLQQKTGYSAVYRVWQELKFYLDVFANQTMVSMKSVAEIYEVWCFLQIKQILENELGFEAKLTRKANIKKDAYLGYKLIKGDKGCFEFSREDGIQVKLYHEKEFKRSSKNIKTFLLTHKPDIVLEVTFDNGEQAFWLFDAKYRLEYIKTLSTGAFAGKPSEKELNNWQHIPVNERAELDPQIQDGVPDDAINQMHRYRDALISITQDPLSTVNRKSRSVFGAFALYPGFFDQANKINPYAQAIDEIGIGAFSLLPSCDGQTGCYWLTNFLTTQLGAAPKKGEVAYSHQKLQEHLYIKEAARIPHYGMKQTLYPDLVMTVAIRGKKGRTQNYLPAFKNGTAEFYHLPKKMFINKFKLHIVEEIRFLALASTSDSDSTSKKIDKLWPVKNVQLVLRHSITEYQGGKISDSDEQYYLFELGKPLTLKDPVCNVPHRPIINSMRLTTLLELESAPRFRDIKKVYEEAFVNSPISVSK